MNLHFITSISKEYWESTAKYCIGTWDLPGKLTVYIDQLMPGDLDWLTEISHHKELLHVPPLNSFSEGFDRNKVLKFWGKSCAQIHAVRNRGVDERVIWIDADMEQLKPVDESLFSFDFSEPLAIMNSSYHEDCWETGLVIFNHKAEKIGVTLNRYEEAWNDKDTLQSLWKPYDAPVLGYVAEQRGYKNLCDEPCVNLDSINHTRYSGYFKHWINKTNKKLLLQKINENNNNIS